MPAPLVLFGLLGLGLYFIAERKPGRSEPSRRFNDGSPADENLPEDTYGAVNTAIAMEPNPPDVGGYQTLVTALTEMATYLRQNYPLASDAVSKRYLALREQAIARGWISR